VPASALSRLPAAASVPHTLVHAIAGGGCSEMRSGDVDQQAPLLINITAQQYAAQL
jgi:hypothetical protein